MKENNLSPVSGLDNLISNNIKFGLINLNKLIEETNYESIKHFNRLCPYCKEDLYAGNIRNKIQYDHFIPIAKGGQDFPWNILPVCSKCNAKKKDKMPNEFLGEIEYKECNEYLKSVLIKYTNQHEDYLQIATQTKFIVKQHLENKINDNKLIENLYQILGIEIKKQPETQNIKTEDTTSNDEHIHFFWEALNQIFVSKKFNKENFYIKDCNTQRIYVSLRKSYPLYIDYCKQNNIAPETSINLRAFLTQSSYKPFIKGNQKGRKLSITKAGLGSCYCFKFEFSKNKTGIVIGNEEIEL